MNEPDGEVTSAPDDNARLVDAAWNDDVAVLESLLKSGCDPDFVPARGPSALHAAIEQLHPRCVAALLAAGASANLRDRSESTPLCHAVDSACDEASQMDYRELSDHSMEVLRLLVQYGADPNLRSPSCRGYGEDVIIEEKLPADIARGYARTELVPLVS